ncbi:MAG: hypothetical protein DRP29_02940 [Thermodesulfobacteriota bacterium]|nr:MAG: hypothetical protein DRP29_02940 [Thermodesulfobacteriota bacterium]
MKKLKFLCCVVIFFIIPSILFAYTTSFQNKKEELSFNLQATVNLKLPFQFNKFLIQSFLVIPEFGLKGDINFQLISTNPLTWELTASYLQIETASFLITLQKLGYVNKKLNLSLKGNLITPLKTKETHCILDFRKIIFPFIYGVKQIVLQNVRIEKKEKIITWQIGRLCIDKTVFTDLSGAYTQKELKINLANITLDMFSFLSAFFKFDPNLKKKLFAKITIYPLKDIQIAGQLCVNNLRVSLEKRDNNFLFKSAQARIKTVKPIVITLFPSFSQKTGHINLQTEGIDFVYTENKGYIKTQKLDIAIKDVDYLSIKHFSSAPKETITLNGGLIFQNVQVILNKEKIFIVLDFQHKPTITLKWHDKIFSFKQLSGHLDYKPNKIKFTNLQTEISVFPKGFVKLYFNGQLPLDFSFTQIDLLIRELEFYPLYLKHIVLKNTTGKEVKASYALEVASLSIKGESRINQKKDKIFVITPKLTILPKKKLNKTNASKHTQGEIQSKPFNFIWTKIIAKIAPKWHLEFDNIDCADFFPLETLKMDIIFQNPTNQLVLNAYACGLSIYGGCDFTTTNLDCFTEVKASSLPLDHLLGCFIHEAPVYITGSTTLQFTASAYGQSNKEFINNIQIEGLATIENGQIMKLSNLRKSLDFILDILHIVRLSPSTLHDALPFDNILCTFKGTSKEVKFKNIRFISPVLRFFAEGNYKINKQIFTLNGWVEKGIFKKSFFIKKDLKE